MRSVRSYDARRTRRSKNPRRVLKTRRVMRDATARGRITVRTAEPMVPTTVKAPATVSSVSLGTGRPTIPTASSPALGTDHVSVEPAILANWRITNFLTLEGDFRYWVPIGGTKSVLAGANSEWVP